jgi:hypothetical protein
MLLPKQKFPVKSGSGNYLRWFSRVSSQVGFMRAFKYALLAPKLAILMTRRFSPASEPHECGELVISIWRKPPLPELSH